MELLTAAASVCFALDKAWAKDGRQPKDFGALATEVLGAARLDGLWDWNEFNDWLFSVRGIPQQFDPLDNFGSPPITLFWHPSKAFFVDIYFWHTPETLLHDHRFSGSCTLLSGESVNFHYDFTPRHVVNSCVQFGDLAVIGESLLVPGDTFAIEPAGALRHRVWHVGVPTVSLVVRNIEYPTNTGQLVYFEPGLAIASNPKFSETVQKRFSYCLTMRKIGHKGWKDMVKSMVAAATPEQAIWLLLLLNDKAEHLDLFDLCSNHLTAICGKDAVLLREAARLRSRLAQLDFEALSDPAERRRVARETTATQFS